MRRAVNYSFLEELGTYWAGALHRDPQRSRNSTGAVAAGSEVSHGAEEVFFSRGQPVKAYPEEILVEPTNRIRGGVLYGLQGDVGLTAALFQAWYPHSCGK